MSTLLIKLLKLPAVLALTATGRSTHHKRIHEGLMVPAVRLGENSVAWPDHEIHALNAARIAGKSDDEIRQLVAKLVEDRKAA
jgi:prophage regulatory protein